MNKTKDEVPKTLFLASMLSISITVPVSISYIVLSALVLVFRSWCSEGNADSMNGADYFIDLVYRVYIQNNNCNSSLTWENVTQPESVFVMTIITLVASVLCCAAAITLMIMVWAENRDIKRQVPLVAYLYIGVCAASLIVDLTFATHFGMDYTYLTRQLSGSSPGLGMNYETDMLRLGALLLMSVCLKGYVVHAINCALLVLIAVYASDYETTSRNEQHSIHKIGALNAYDQPRRVDPWQQEPEMIFRGAQTNPAYVEEVPVRARSPINPVREPVTNDFSRSDSWQTARPFSYLEEPKRAAGASSSSVPRARAAVPEPSWRDSPAVSATLPSTPAQPWRSDARADWSQPPPVPAPDYSPHTPRRLKPALKTYM